VFEKEGADPYDVSPHKNSSKNNSQAEHNSPNGHHNKTPDYAQQILLEQLESEIKALNQDKTELKSKVERMSENLRKIRYNDVTEKNRLNETNENLKEEIERLQDNETSRSNLDITQSDN
jgi:predicted RNase H-like nuclease (RuvC/YqgF family)